MTKEFTQGEGGNASRIINMVCDCKCFTHLPCVDSLLHVQGRPAPKPLSRINTCPQIEYQTMGTDKLGGAAPFIPGKHFDVSPENKTSMGYRLDGGVG